MSLKTTVAAIAMLLAAGTAHAQSQQPARTGTQPAAPASQPARPAQATLVNVNTANSEELDKLPQIGPARAKAILDNRVAAKGGACKDLADLEKRADLPKNAMEAIKDKIRFR